MPTFRFVGDVEADDITEAYEIASEALSGFEVTEEGSGVRGMPFHEALKGLIDGSLLWIRLPKWSSDVVICCQRPDANSKMTHQYLYVDSRFGMVPWMPTIIEMFAGDWEEAIFNED